MKIGLIVPGFSADERDWCIPAHLNLARRLAVEHRVHVFTLRYPRRRDVYNVFGAKVHSFNGEGSRGFASLHLWTTAWRALAREHQESPLEILHSIYGGEAGLVTVLAARGLRVPSIVSFLGGELVRIRDIGYGQGLQWRQHLMNQITLRFADQVLGGSEGMSKLARAHTSVSRRARIRTLPLGVDTLMFSPAPASLSGYEKEGVRVLNVGSLIPVKDQANLLRAFARLTQDLPNARLSIIGTGRLESQLHALAFDMQIAERVDFVGAVAHHELPEWYRRADLFVQSSRHEGEGMAVLEAAASGVAIAGTDVGVLSDLAARGAAIPAPPNDANALADAMHHALASRAALGTRVRDLARREYNLEGIGERLIELYRSTSKVKDARPLAQPLPRS